MSASHRFPHSSVDAKNISIYHIVMYCYHYSIVFSNTYCSYDVNLPRTVVSQWFNFTSDVCGPNDFNLPRKFASQKFQFTWRVRISMSPIYYESSRPNDFKLHRNLACQRFQFTTKSRVPTISIYPESSCPNDFNLPRSSCPNDFNSPPKVRVPTISIYLEVRVRMTSRPYLKCDWAPNWIHY